MLSQGLQKLLQNMGHKQPCERPQRPLPCPSCSPRPSAFTALPSLCSGLFLIRKLWGPHPVINLGLTSISILCWANAAGCSFLLVGPDTIGFSTEINGLIAKAPFGGHKEKHCFFHSPQPGHQGLPNFIFEKPGKQFCKEGLGWRGIGESFRSSRERSETITGRIQKARLFSDCGPVCKIPPRNNCLSLSQPSLPPQTLSTQAPAHPLLAPAILFPVNSLGCLATEWSKGSAAFKGIKHPGSDGRL